MDLESVLKATAEKLRIDFKLLSDQVGHRGSKGKIREAELIEGFLRPHLPSNIAIAHGAEIVSVDGSVSNECDIVLYDQNAMAFIEKTDYRVLPIEAVYVVIEVKSFLSKGELLTSVAAIEKIKSMNKTAYSRPNISSGYRPLISDSRYISRSTSAFGKIWNYFPTFGYIFAYNSHGLESLRRNLFEFHEDIPVEHGVDGVWVLEKGVVIHWSDARNEMLYAGDPDGYFRVGYTDNPLLLMLVMLQMWCQNAWMPPFDIRPYLLQSSMLRLGSRSTQGRPRQTQRTLYMPISSDAPVGQTSPNSFIVEWETVGRRTEQRDESGSD